MSRTIWKFPLEITDQQRVMMPFGATPLSVGVQNERVCLWCRVEDENTPQERTVYLVGTGHPLSDAVQWAIYVGTVQTHGGSLVRHVFMEM